MSLFLRTGRRSFLEVSDAYIMILGFLLSYWVTTIVKNIIIKQKQIIKKYSKNNVNLRGGKLNVGIDESEEKLAKIILSCIKDQEQYFVLDERMKELIFYLVKQKLNNNTIVLTPNLLQYLALYLLSNRNQDNSIIVSLNDFILLVIDNGPRLRIRVIASFILGAVAKLTFLGSYAALLRVLVFMETDNFYNCDKYFQAIPKDSPIIVPSPPNPKGLLIVSDDPTPKVYAPADVAVALTGDNLENIQISHKSVANQVKSVTFDNFKQNHALFSKYKDMEELRIPEKQNMRELLRKLDINDIIE